MGQEKEADVLTLPRGCENENERTFFAGREGGATRDGRAGRHPPCGGWFGRRTPPAEEG
jgi:hypothetical protein